MRMCKYCGAMVKGGFGPRGLYCSRDCWMAVDGFDMRLRRERQDAHNGHVSIDRFRAKGGEVSDGGADMRSMFDRLDGTEPEYNPKMDIGEAMRAAAEIHPLLPSALVLLSQGATQAKTAKIIGLDQGNVAKYIKQLRTTIATKAN